MQHPDKSDGADFEGIRAATRAGTKEMFHPFTASRSTHKQTPREKE